MKNKPDHIKVFIIDKDVLMRRKLSNILKKEADVSIYVSADESGFEKVISRAKNEQLSLLFLGVEELKSKEMDLFYKLRESRPNLNIVLMPRLNSKGAAVVLQGLNRGALDYVTKPDSNVGLLFADRHFHKRVIPLLKAVRKQINRLEDVKSIDSDDRAESKAYFPEVGQMSPAAIDIIVFGGCLGGVPSLYKIITDLPESLDIPVVVVQHMPKYFTRKLSEDLDRLSNVKVKEATDSCLLSPGTVYIAPGGFHSVIKNDYGQKQIVLHKGPREHKCRPSIDVLLRSAVKECDGNVLAVLLSGIGKDGVLGALNVLENGGIIMLESRESTQLPELVEKVKMLNSSIREIPAEKMSQEIMDYVKKIEQQSINDFSSDQFKISSA